MDLKDHSTVSPYLYSYYICIFYKETKVYKLHKQESNCLKPNENEL